MERVLQNTTATIGVTFQVDGIATDPTPATVTVQILRDDGTELVPAGTATTRTTAGTFTYNLQTTHTTLLDNLTALWTSTNFGVLTTHAEIVGGYVFSIAQLRASSPALQDVVMHPAADLIELRTTVEDALEQELGYAPVPRYTTTTIVGTSTTLQLKPYLRAVRSISDIDQAVLVTDLDVSTYGFVSGYTFHGPTVVRYEHGLDAAPPRARAMALSLAKAWAITGPVDDRATSFTSDVGITSTLATPGLGGSIFGVPAVDQWVRSARLVSFA